MNTIKKSASYVAIAFLGAVLALLLYSRVNKNENPALVAESRPVQLSSYIAPVLPQGQLPDLTMAAEKSVSAVVHITTKTKNNMYESGSQLFEFFFGEIVDNGIRHLFPDTSDHWCCQNDIPNGAETYD